MVCIGSSFNFKEIMEVKKHIPIMTKWEKSSLIWHILSFTLQILMAHVVPFNELVSDSCFSKYVLFSLLLPPQFRPTANRIRIPLEEVKFQSLIMN